MKETLNKMFSLKKCRVMKSVDTGLEFTKVYYITLARELIEIKIVSKRNYLKWHLVVLFLYCI